MEALEPLVPPEVDLRDFPFMPLDVVRLRDSRLAAISSGDEFMAWVLLACASWHQRPAGSLPNDDVELARLAGFGRAVREWMRVRSGALHGWVLCSDGRYYHPVVAEKAVEAWAEKHAYRDRKAKRIATAKAAADARWHEQAQCDEDADAMRDASEVDAQRIPNASELDANRNAEGVLDAMPKGTGTGTGKKENIYGRFDEFWEAYPSRGGHANPKHPARQAWGTAIKSGADPGDIVAAARRYAEAVSGEEPRHVCQARTWLHQQRWRDYLGNGADRLSVEEGRLKVYRETGTWLPNWGDRCEAERRTSKDDRPPEKPRDEGGGADPEDPLAIPEFLQRSPGQAEAGGHGSRGDRLRVTEAEIERKWGTG